MKTDTSESHDAVTPQDQGHAERESRNYEPDRVSIARAQAAVLKLLAKVILESHNRPIDRT